jgi:hypothetical protein
MGAAFVACHDYHWPAHAANWSALSSPQSRVVALSMEAGNAFFGTSVTDVNLAALASLRFSGILCARLGSRLSIAKAEKLFRQMSRNLCGQRERRRSEAAMGSKREENRHWEEECSGGNPHWAPTRGCGR